MKHKIYSAISVWSKTLADGSRMIETHGTLLLANSNTDPRAKAISQHVHLLDEGYVLSWFNIADVTTTVVDWVNTAELDTSKE